MVMLLRNIFKVDLYSFQCHQGFFSASERTYVNIHLRVNKRCSTGLELVRSLSRLGSWVCAASPSVKQIRNLGMLLLLSGYHQGPTQSLEVGDMGLCTQARHTLMFRSFAAFMGSTVLSLGLSAVGPTALQT